MQLFDHLCVGLGRLEEAARPSNNLCTSDQSVCTSDQFAYT